MTELSLLNISAGDGFSGLLSRLKATTAVWQQRSRQRRFLAQLDRRQRADLGAPADAIAREIAKPFWRG